MADYELTVKDNSGEILKLIQAASKRALEAIGAQAEGYAKQNLTDFPRVDTGRLRNSVAHKVIDNEQEKAVYIGTNVFYAPYVEWGTGRFADNGKGRKTAWKYVDKNGVGHWTVGMRPSHFLRNAVSQHQHDYIEILRAALGAE